MLGTSNEFRKERPFTIDVVQVAPEEELHGDQGRVVKGGYVPLPPVFVLQIPKVDVVVQGELATVVDVQVDVVVQVDGVFYRL